MTIPPLFYAIPIFLVFILFEYFVSLWTRENRPVYRLNDSINDISTGILQLVSGMVFRVIVVGIYVWVYESFRIWDIPQTLGWWVLLFFAVDCCYYWFHRASHEMNAPWAAHVVHHQSEEYNLSVALRQSSFQSLFSWIFYIPLALIGFPPIMTFVHKLGNTLYQFWIHTRLIGKLGPLEWIINTPSHHRVHHARNAHYLDKNYAGVLIIWDRMFGTFKEEQEEPTYGVTKALNSWNPLYANIHTWAYLYELMRRAPRWQDKFKVWVMPPSWMPAGLGPLRERGEADERKYDPAAPRMLKFYIVVHFIVTVLVMMALLVVEKSLPHWAFAAVAGWITISLVSFGGLFEGRRWVPLYEFCRLLVSMLGVSFALGATYWVLLSGFVGLLALVVWVIVLAESRSHFLIKAPASVELKKRAAAALGSFADS